MTVADTWAQMLRAFTHPELPDDPVPPPSTSAPLQATSQVAKTKTAVSPEQYADSAPGHLPGSQAGQQEGSEGDSAITDQSDAEDVDEDDHASEPAWSSYWQPAEGARALHEAVSIVLAQCDAAERRQRATSGTRARTADSLRIHHGQLRATVCLAAKGLMRGAPPFRVPASNRALKGARTRYTDPLLTANLRTALHLLIDEGFIVHTTDAVRPQRWKFDPKQATKQGGRQATYAAGPRLAPLLADVQLTDIRRAPGDEIILLKSKRDDFGMAELVDYKRTPAHVATARAELAELNAFREFARVECLGSPSRFDVSDRHSRRRWTRASWHCGGRHWGGFWQTMRKAERLNLIQIDGEPVVGIDYVGTIVTLAYASVGQPLPEGDPYDFVLVDKSGSTVETTRKHRKTIFIAAMNGAKEWPREMRSTFRHRISWRRTVDCMAQAHPHIAVFFTADRGQELAFTEANILAAVLRRLMLQGVVGLDMFDCVLVKRSAVELATTVMLEEFQRIAGQPARVSIERPEDHPLHVAAVAPVDGVHVWDF